MANTHKLFCSICTCNRTFQTLNNKYFLNVVKIFSISNHYFHFRDYSLWKVDLPKEVNKPFLVLDGTITKCDEFERNRQAYKVKESYYDKILELTLKGGGEKAIERHVKKQKKMLVNDRIKSLLDNKSKFLELSTIGGMGMKYGDVPRTGIVTGIGKIHDKYCMIIANDATVKGGSVYPITLKKQLRAQEIAEQNRLPCFYIVESGGAFLPLQSEIFPDKNQGGRTFYNEAVMSAQNIPQVAIVCGSCTAGGAYIPTMADEAVIVHKNGTIFLAGPPLVQAALGEIISAEELGGATLHCRTSGCTDYFAGTEKEAFKIGRDIMVGLNVEDKSNLSSCIDIEEPIYDVNDICGLIPHQHQHQLDIYQIIARIVDGSRFQEFKKLYGINLVCGFSYLNGYLVGIIGNQGDITQTSALKGSHFVSLCSERNIPLIFLQNTSSVEEELNGVEMSEKLKACGKLMAAVSCSTVPKLTVRIGNGLGTSQYMMGGRCISPNFIFSWPNAILGIMSPSLVAEELSKNVLSDLSVEEINLKKQELVVKLTNEMSAIYTSAHLLDDGIIKPVETRKILGECLRIVQAYQTHSTTDYPVFRM
ncbi:hypothetical protein SNE40_011771 [Patella caerulea]|uniref:methylcrotonoyl-CoA carboxylase n=1 Tax=Patella caerulea TaxID=87958 RepID=A0AAN8JPG0_PATCE